MVFLQKNFNYFYITERVNGKKKYLQSLGKISEEEAHEKLLEYCNQIEKIKNPINEIFCGDSLHILRRFQNDFFDAIVTDPPAGIGFMEKTWDGDRGGHKRWIVWLTSIMREGLRVLKPGGHAFVWALPRTSHWTGSALSDAGFEIRDIVHHIFASGFPKSMDVGKAINKVAGEENFIQGNNHNSEKYGCIHENITAPATENTIKWGGWGTNLKPATEHWLMCRKPLGEPTVAENILRWGTGGINIEACRVPTISGRGMFFEQNVHDINYEIPPSSRYPANLVHDGSDCVLEEFAKYGKTKSSISLCRGLGLPKGGIDGAHPGWRREAHKRYKPRLGGYNDSGTPARFFYCAKSSSAEREQGLEELKCENAGRANNHPTVKSRALMSYLIKMITPPGGSVLDMFCGSGSTLCSAAEGGFLYTGIDITQEYCDISRRRVAAVISKKV